MFPLSQSCTYDWSNNRLERYGAFRAEVQAGRSPKINLNQTQEKAYDIINE